MKLKYIIINAARHIYVQAHLCASTFMCKHIYVQAHLCASTFMCKHIYVQAHLCAICGQKEGVKL